MTKVDLNQLASRREQILFGLVGLVLVVLSFRVFYAGQMKQMKLSWSRLAALKLEKDALIKFASSTPALGTGSSLSRKGGIKSRILTGEIRSDYRDVSSVLQEVTDPGFLGHVIVENLNYLPTVPDQGWSKTDFTLKVRGSFTEILQYLERLEQFPALFNLQNIGLTVAEGQPQDVQAEILGRFYGIQLPGSSSMAIKSGGHP